MLSSTCRPSLAARRHVERVAADRVVIMADRKRGRAGGEVEWLAAVAAIPALAVAPIDVDAERRPVEVGNVARHARRAPFVHQAAAVEARKRKRLAGDADRAVDLAAGEIVVAAVDGHFSRNHLGSVLSAL